MSDPGAAALDWACAALGRDTVVVQATRLRGDRGTWRISVRTGPDVIDLVLRSGPASDWRHAWATEAAALRVAEEHDLPAPRLVAVELEAQADGDVRLLSTYVPGSSAIPRVVRPEQLRAVGRATATLHAIRMQPTAELPLRVRHTPWTDYAEWRRLSARYRSAGDAERVRLLAEFVAAFPGWGPSAAHGYLLKMRSTALLDHADAVLRSFGDPVKERVFVHADLWHGNVIWMDGDSEERVALIDWEAAGVGDPGVDLGCLRWDAATLWGEWASDELLASWEEAAGRRAASVAYWDIVAALNTPTDVGAFVPALHAAGRPDLDVRTVSERRDAFLRGALERLTR